MATWLLWKRAHEVVRLRVMADVAATTGITENELNVLVQLHDAGGTLRQNALALSTGWDRTRLSHLLTRLEGRGQVARRKLVNGVEVCLQPDGAALFDTARPALEAAVRQHLFDRLSAEDRRALHHALKALLTER